MNVVEIKVTNITKVVIGVRPNTVWVIADFSHEGGTKKQVARLLMMGEYQHVLEHGYYLG